MHVYIYVLLYVPYEREQKSDITPYKILKINQIYRTNFEARIACVCLPFNRLAYYTWESESEIPLISQCSNVTHCLRITPSSSPRHRHYQIPSLTSFFGKAYGTLDVNICNFRRYFEAFLIYSDYTRMYLVVKRESRAQTRWNWISVKC